jgi:hypothetical protein
VTWNVTASTALSRAYTTHCRSCWPDIIHAGRGRFSTTHAAVGSTFSGASLTSVSGARSSVSGVAMTGPQSFFSVVCSRRACVFAMGT